MKQTPEEWQAEWAAQIGRNVAALREEHGKVSARELSERCTALGYPIPRNTIANLESGRKATVPVHEVAVIARALGVAPVQILFDVTGPAFHVLPDDLRLPIEGIEWFAGNQPFIDPPGLESHGSYAGARSIVVEGSAANLFIYRALLKVAERIHEYLEDIAEIEAELRAAERAAETGEPDVFADLLPQEPPEVWRQRLDDSRKSLNRLRTSLDAHVNTLRARGAQLPSALPVEDSDD